VGPGGTHYYPAFPFTAYSGMKPEDITALFEYLQRVPAVARENRAHELPWYFDLRILNRLWKLFFFTPQLTPAERGEYLVRVLGHCDECHTPRNRLGVLVRDRHLAGNPLGPDGDPVPNITPDRETGIGRWGRSDLIRYLKSGRLPDSDFAGGAMVEVIDDGLRYLDDADIAAIADYLRALPPRPSASGDR
jgi:mono/diheme cytochrome c family protein